MDKYNTIRLSLMCIIFAYIVYIIVGGNKNTSSDMIEEDKGRIYENLIENENYRKQFIREDRYQHQDIVSAQNDMSYSAQETYININDITNRYQYAMYDTIGQRNDLTIDLLIVGDQLMNQFGLNPDLLFGIIMVESEGHADKINPYSGAKGLGQFLPDTGRFIFNTYIDKAMVYDDNTTPFNAEYNLRMTAYYLNYLYINHNNSTMDVIKEYCGGDYEFSLSYYYRVCNVVGYCID